MHICTFDWPIGRRLGKLENALCSSVAINEGRNIPPFLIKSFISCSCERDVRRVRSWPQDTCVTCTGKDKNPHGLGVDFAVLVDSGAIV